MEGGRKGWRKKGREEEREGGRKGERKEGREEGREGGRKEGAGWREEGREGGRKEVRERERKKERKKEITQNSHIALTCFAILFRYVFSSFPLI
jgi:hypothetical protein